MTAVVRRARLDVELVRRGLVRSREQAAEAIAAGRVRVGGVAATKAATAVGPDAALRLDGPAAGTVFASRGGCKLAGALTALAGRGTAPTIAAARCLDAGASTGGFTDVLLRRGAASVHAVDVGYGQLAWALRTDARVTVLDRTNVRTLTPAQVGGPVDVTVADLSFIPLRLVLPALTACTRPTGQLLLLVKPQFEVGRERLPAGGVVRDPALRAAAVLAAATAAVELGLVVCDVTASPLPGPAGNVEYFLLLRREGDSPPAAVPEGAVATVGALAAAVDRAVAEGPA